MHGMHGLIGYNGRMKIAKIVIMLSVLVLTTLALLTLTGCGALDYARGRVADRVEDLARTYCDQPRSVRAIVRVETNNALEDTASIVVACAGEPGYDELRRLYVEPLSNSTIDALVGELLKRGSITLPDGTILRIVADQPAE